MKKSLEYLHEITMLCRDQDMTFEDAMNDYPDKLNKFLDALEEDIPQANDKEDEHNFLEELFIKSGQNPNILGDYLSNIREFSEHLIAGQESGDDDYTVEIENLDTFWKEINKRLPELRQKQLPQKLSDTHIENINHALANNDSEALNEHLKRFGEFQNTVSSMGVKVNIDTTKYKSMELPNLSLIANLQTSSKDDDVQKSIDIYFEYMGKERMEPALNLVADQEKIIKAGHVVDELKKKNIECRDELHKAISKEIKQIPALAEKYTTPKSGESKSKTNVDQLIADLETLRLDQSKWKFTNEQVDLLSDSLLINIVSYRANSRLLNTLDSNENNLAKLKKYQNEYESKATKNAFGNNPDGRIKRFFIAYGYLLANIFTLGAVHLITKASPLHSKQQEFGKKQEKILKAAVKDDVIKPTQPKR